MEASRAGQPAQDTFMRGIIQDLNHTVTRIHDVSSRAGSIADRLGGPTPPDPSPSKTGGLSTVPTNISDELRSLLSRAQDHLIECESRLSRIENFV